MKKIIYTLLLFQIVVASAYSYTKVGENIGDPYYYTNYQSFQKEFNTNDYLNDYYAPTKDICLHFRLTLPAKISFSTLEGNSAIKSSNLYLLKRSFDSPAYSSNMSECSLIKQGTNSMSIDSLGIGTYYLIFEGQSQNGNITITTEATTVAPFGDTMNKSFSVYPMDGSKPFDFYYTNTQNTSDFTNNYGTSSNDVYYKLTIPDSIGNMNISVSTCESEGDTYLSLLNASGNLITDNDDYTGVGYCYISTKKAMINATLSPGIYYVVSEGFNYNGSVTTTINGTISDKQISTIDDQIITVSGTNYIQTILPNIKISDVSTLSNTQSVQKKDYFDGLGRPIETVMKAYTPSGKDLVSTTVYDGVGRKWQKWLPAASNNTDGSFVNINNFQATQISTYGDSKPFSQSNYEPSPLNRVTGLLGAGAVWHNNQKKDSLIYATNTSNEVKYFYVDNSGQLILNGFYNVATLYKAMALDEDRKQAIEYKDNLGRVVMLRNGNSDFADTYYVYNDLDKLCYVIPPLAADALGSGSYSEATDAVKKFGYVYKYDVRGNCIYKKLPGCEPIYMTYDKANRLVLSQDGKQRENARWTMSTYDTFGRILYTLEVSSTESHSSLIKFFSNGVDIDTYSSNGSGDVPNTGYAIYNNKIITITRPSVPGGPIYQPSVAEFALVKLISINYYDNYKFRRLLNATDSTNLKFVTKTGYDVQYGEDKAKGLLTGTRTYMLDAPNKYLISAMYYDDKGRMVQSRTKNYLGTYDYTYNAYNFNGLVTATYIDHTGNFPEEYTYSYDNAGRPLETFHKYSMLPSVKLTSNSYNELCQLTGKLRHGNTDTEGFQYNIRGWLKKITSGTFEEDLFYNTNPLNSNTCYNGNISYVTWKNNSTTLNGYLFRYDDLNRLNVATYAENNIEFEDYQYQEGFNYDKQGNIENLERYSKYGEPLDLLTFNYTGTGNQVNSISDGAGSQNMYNIKEYQNIAGNGTNEMGYDKNGNLIKDNDRKIVTIKYNLLNLPDTVQFSNGNVIINHYSAGGQKLRSDYYTRLTAITPLGENVVLNPEKGYSDVLYSYTGTAYVGNMEYSISKGKSLYYDGSWVYYDTYTPSKIYTPEGYIDYLNPSIASILNLGVRYNYFRKDHLGNTREVWNGARKNYTGVLKEVAATRQRMQYYPSGTPWAENIGTSVQNKKYNGKEFIEAHGLDETDLGNRGLYHAIDRFTSIDRFCEKYPWQSPYVFAANNPVNYIDINGDSIFIDKYGTVSSAQRDAKGNLVDNYVFTTNKDGSLKSLGELGKSVDVQDILTNLLEQNSIIADGIWDPRDLRDLVKGDGDWDLKVNDKTIFGLANLEVDGKNGNDNTQFLFANMSLEAQDVGNLHYGVVGKAMGFPETTLLKQAGLAQIGAKTSRPEWIKYHAVSAGPLSTLTMLPPYGDNPRDQYWIKRGFSYYRKYKPDGDKW